MTNLVNKTLKVVEGLAALLDSPAPIMDVERQAYQEALRSLMEVQDFPIWQASHAELLVEADKLVNLLKAPEPGLRTWNEFFFRSMVRIGGFSLKGRAT